MRRWLTFALGLLVSALFIWLGFRNLHLDKVVEIISDIQIGWLILAAVVYQVAAYIITWRWYYLLHPIKEVHPHRLFPVVLIGYMGNNIYPARIGELIRAYILKRREGIAYAPSLATIIVERIFDGLVMLIFIFTALLFVDFEDPTVRTILVSLTPLFFGALVIFSVLALRPHLTRRVYTSIMQVIIPVATVREKLLHIADHFMTGLETLRSPRLLLLTWLSSLLSWTIEATTYWIVLQAFDFNVSFWVLMLVIGLGNLSTILPSTPGYFGTFHGVVVLILSAFDVPSDQAGAYAIVMHLVLWLPVTVLGAIFLYRLGMGWHDLAEATHVGES